MYESSGNIRSGRNLLWLKYVSGDHSQSRWNQGGAYRRCRIEDKSLKFLTREARS